MNCFNHENVPAVGVCRACGKGLCRTCAAESPRGLVCDPPCGASLEPDPAVGWLKKLSGRMRIETNRSAGTLVGFGGLFAIIAGILVFVALETCSTGLGYGVDGVGPLFLTGLILFLGLSAVLCFVGSGIQFSSARCFDEDGGNEAPSNAEEAGGNEG